MWTLVRILCSLGRIGKGGNLYSHQVLMRQSCLISISLTFCKSDVVYGCLHVAVSGLILVCVLLKTFISSFEV